MADQSPSGFRVAVTADRRWEEQAELLRALGASVIHVPTIRTVATGPDDELFAVTERLVVEAPATLLVVTGLGVRSWFAAARSWGIAEQLTASLRRSRIVASVQAARALRSVGLDADMVVSDLPGTAAAGPGATAGNDGTEPEPDDPLASTSVPASADADAAAAVIRGLTRDVVSSGVVVVERFSPDDASVTATCRMLGAAVIEVPVHRWVLPADIEAVAHLAELIGRGEIDAVTFTSAPALRNLVLVAEERMSIDAMRAACGSKVLLAVVGPVCATAARQLDLRGIVMPERFRVAAMIDTLGNELTARRARAPVHRSAS